MKKQLTLLFAIILNVTNVCAQEVTLHETQKGFYVAFGKQLPYDFNYQISRREGNGPYKIIGETKLPGNKSDYELLVKKFQILLNPLPLPHETQVTRMWNYIHSSRSADSLIITSMIEQVSLGLAWIDATVETGKRYQYKVEKIKNGTVEPLAETTQKTFSSPSSIQLPQANYFKHVTLDGNIILEWLLLDKSGIAGFEAFRRDNLKGEFKKLSVPIRYVQRNDSIFIHTNDSSANKFEVYEYKLRPYDLFGNPGGFTAIAKVSNFTTNDFPVLQSFKAVAIDSRQIKLQWAMDFEPFLRSIKILRSESFDTDFIEIAEVSPRDSIFIDVLPRSMENYYYRLKINGPDEVDISSSSTFILYESDLEAERPDLFAARTIVKGVELHWEDKQRNVFGYYVYRKERDENFVQISEPVLKNKNGVYHYKDSAASLHGDRFYDYAVKTISDSYKLSQFSDTLSVRPGIEVTVNAPRNVRGRKEDDKVFLIWDDLSQTDNNLWGYKVFRKKSFDTTYAALNDSLLREDTNHFIDSTMEKGFAYDYVVTAYNYFGGVSEFSNTIQFQFYLRLPTPPSSVQAQKLSTGIRVVWGDVMVPELAGFNLYRYTPDKKPVLIKNVSSDQHDFVDDQVERGKLYFYYVTSSNAEKIEGRPSEKISVRY